jgi:outer membrane protein TolC
MSEYSSSAVEPTTMVLGVRDNYTVQLAVDQVIFAGNALRQVYQGARDMRQGSAAQIRQARAEAAYNAEQGFYGLYLARQAIGVLEEGMGTMDAYVRDLSNLVTVGIGSRSDLLSAQAQQSRSRLDLMKARRGAQVAEMAFRASLGLPEDEPLELLLGDRPESSLPTDRATLLEMARRYRPEMNTLDATVNALGHYARASWSSWVPTVALNATYLGQNPNPYAMMLNPEGASEWFWSTNVTLVASWSIWDQGSALFGHKAARASLAQLRHQRALLLDMLPVEIEGALGTHEESLAAVEVARIGLDQAEEAFRLEKNRFDQGMSNNTQILLSQSSLSGARLALLQAETTLRSSHAALRKAVGIDPGASPSPSTPPYAESTR